MFKLFWKTNCQKVRGKLSEYLDGQLSPKERQFIESHIKVCKLCREELESLKATLELLHRIPEVLVPRLFTLTEVPRRASPFEVLVLKWLHPIAMATAMLLIALLIADFAGLFIPKPAEKGLFPSAEKPAPKVEETLLLTPTPERKKDELASQTLKAPPGAEIKPTPASPEATPTPPTPEIEEKALPREVPSWLRPLEITLGGLSIVFGGTTLFVRRQRKRS